MKKTFDLWDGMIIAGAVAIVVGIWLLSPPAAVIIGGILLIIGGVLGAAHKGRERARAGNGSGVVQRESPREAGK
jgi:uncharacterized membrane protein HdeD (DUF308 family)